MFFLFSGMTGVIIAVMILVNGGLTSVYGIFGATVIIHIVGSAFAFVALKAARKPLRLKGAGLPFWMFLGGVIGFFTTVFNNFSFGRISMGAIVALGLLGQMAASLLIDAFGLFGMRRVPFRPSTLVGLGFAGAGIFIMTQGAEVNALYAVAFSFLAGVTVALSRVVNAGLSNQIGVLQGSFVNHLVGLPVALAALMLFGGAEPIFTGVLSTPAAWVYFGGVLGVAVVALSNFTVPKISSFLFTLLCFAGQIFSGIAMDALSGQAYSRAMLQGTVLVAVGIVANMILDRFEKSKK